MATAKKSRKAKWWVGEAYDHDGLYSYVVVCGKGTDPGKLMFSSHGHYLLKSAAQEDCDSLNKKTGKVRGSRLVNPGSRLYYVFPVGKKPDILALKPHEGAQLIELLQMMLADSQYEVMSSLDRALLQKIGVNPKYIPPQKPFDCKKCRDTGIIETGNNDLACDCPKGDKAMFNIAGDPTPRSGRWCKQNLYNKRRKK
jgi:hypothetical protein